MGVETLNLALFKAINAFAGHFKALDILAIFLASYLPYIFILVLGFLFLFKKDFREPILCSGYAACVGLLVNFTIAYFYFHPRPFMEHIGKLLIPHDPETSFPSDHTTFMLSVGFTLLAFKSTRKLGIMLSILGIIGGIARVYCGLHWPFDILGSFLISLLASAFVVLIKSKIRCISNLILSVLPF